MDLRKKSNYIFLFLKLIFVNYWKWRIYCVNVSEAKMSIFCWKNWQKKTFEKYLNMLDIFRIEEWKPLKLSLVKIHHEELVSWRQIQFFQGELLIKVAHVFTMFLCEEKKGDKIYNKNYLILFINSISILVI